MNEQPGHFLEHLIEDVDATSLHTWGWTDHARFSMVKQFLHDALLKPRFFLPKGGLLLDLEFNKLSAVASQQPVRIPYPKIVMEFYDTSNHDTSKNVLLLDEYSDNEVEIIMFSQITSFSKVWRPLKVSFVFHYEDPNDRNSKFTMGVSDMASGRAAAPESCPRDLVFYIIAIVLNLVVALRCSNVDTYIVTPSDALNKKRIGANRVPFSDYHILTVRQSHTVHHDPTSTHASPRQHLRRGHIRRLDETRTVWVNQCLVGNAAHGVVDKDYRLNAVHGH